MKAFTVKRMRLFFIVSFVFGCVVLQQPASASPFGKGVFGADVPFGSATSIAISLSGTVNMNLTPNAGTGSDSHVVTVTSTDVVGYDLYVKSTTSTSMSNGTDTLATSANGSPATLAVNTWGYNTSGSTTDFKGMTLSDVSIRSASGPYKNGHDTTVTYGAQVDITKSSGTYNVDVTYTAIGQS